MAYNIILGQQSFSGGGGNQILSQDWSFLPPQVQVTSTFFVLQAYPQPVDVTINIRDFLNSPFAATHTNFNLIVSLQQDVNAIDLFDITSTTHVITAPIVLDNTTVLAMLITVAFVDPTILLEGVYSGQIVFTVQATNNVTSLVEDIDVQIYDLELSRTGTTVNVLTPRVLNFAYLQGAPSPVQDFDIIPGLDVNGNQLYSVNQSGDLVLNVPGTVISPLRTDGNGVVTGSLSLNPATWDGVPPGLYDTFVNVVFVTQLVMLGIDINVAVFNAPGVIITPDNLEFVMYVPVTPQAQFIDIFSTGTFTIGGPPWLILSASSGIGSARISVQPVDYTNVSEGVFEGFISVVSDGVVYNINVKLSVFGQLQTTVDSDNINFTKDLAYFSINSPIYVSSLFYMQVRTYGMVYDLDGNAIEIDHTNKVPFFKNQARFVPGTTIDKVIPLYDQLVGNLLLQPDPLIDYTREYYARVAVMSFDVAVFNRSLDTAVFQTTVRNIKWLKGTRPLNNVYNRAPLVYDKKVARIDDLGFYIYNYFSQEASSIVLLKNNVFLTEIATRGGDYPTGRILIKGKDFEPGDVIEIKATDLLTRTAASEFLLIYPLEEHTYHVAYLTEYNTIDVIQCRGEMASKSAYERRGNKILRNGVDVIKHVDVNRDDNLVINTGFIPQDQIVMVDMLKRSIRSWLIFPDMPPIEMAVISTDLAGYDSEKFLYEYEIEVQLNRKVDAQIHTF